VTVEHQFAAIEKRDQCSVLVEVASDDVGINMYKLTALFPVFEAQTLLKRLST
jgi:hypothetical protein